MVITRLWFWKIVFGIGAAFSIWATFELEPYHLPDGSTEQYNDAVKAAIFAVLAALMLFLTQIPNSFSDFKGARLADVLFSGIGAVAAVATGWFWIQDETHQNPFAYLTIPVGVGVFFLLCLVFMGIFGDLKERYDRRRSQRNDGSNQTTEPYTHGGFMTKTYKYNGEIFNLNDSGGCYVEVAYLDQVGYVGVNLEGTAEQPYRWNRSAEAISDAKDGLRVGPTSGSTFESNLQALCENMIRTQKESDARRVFKPEDACESLHEFIQNLSSE